VTRRAEPAPLPRLHVVTDPRPDRDVLADVDAALTGGAPCVQVRVKDATTREHLALAEAVVARCHAAGAWCVVNDRVDIALASGADAVHLGADDLPVAAARRLADARWLADAATLAGARLVIGGTARDPATARRVVADGADYLGVGPVYGTRTKSGLPDPLGVDRFGEVAAAVDVPVLAIAGITVQRVGEVVAAGAHGVAVVGAVSDAADPAAATRALVHALSAAGP
jgi:thiamine-phosphate pyrophosphorylase